MRSLAVVVFIAIVAATAGFAAQRRTVARGEVMAADLLKSNQGVLTGMSCDPEIPIGLDGAQFWCDAVFARGGTRRLHFQLARTGQIKQIGEDPRRDTGAAPAKVIDKSGERPARSTAEGGAKVIDKSGERPARSTAEGGAKVIDKADPWQ